MPRNRHDLRSGIGDEKLLNFVAAASVEIFKLSTRSHFTGVEEEQQKRRREIRDAVKDFAADPQVSAGLPDFASLPSWEQQSRILDTAFLILAERREQEKRTIGL